MLTKNQAIKLGFEFITLMESSNFCELSIHNDNCFVAITYKSNKRGFVFYHLHWDDSTFEVLNRKHLKNMRKVLYRHGKHFSSLKDVA